MNNVVSQTIDVVDYIINEDLEKLAEVVTSLSDSARRAYIPTVEETQNMEDNNFAVVLWHPTLGKFNKFALYEPAITEINITLLSNNMENLPEEIVKIAGNNLTCAAKGFGIDIPENLKKYSSDTFIENIVDIREINSINFAKKAKKVNKKYATFGKEYPINNVDEVMKAAEYFDIYHNSFSPDTKIEYATNVSKAAKNFNIDLSDTLLDKYANLDNTAFSNEFQQHIKSRTSFLMDSQEEEKTLYNDLLQRSEEIGPSKTAEVLYIIDKQTGLAEHYGKGIADPLIATMLIKKEANTLVDGVSVTLDQLKKIPGTDLTPLIGTLAISELKGKDGIEVLASLPKPVRQEVLKLIK